MIVAKNLINDYITPLRISDSGEFAIHLMDELKVSHLPIVTNNLLVGLVGEDDILGHHDIHEQLGNYSNTLIRPFVNENEHIYEVLKTVTTLKLTVLPVVTSEQVYLGCLSQSTLLNKITEMASMIEPGGLIILRMNIVDYSLSEIARMVESNDAKILSSYITSSSNAAQMEVTIKINREDLSPILQTFSRYNLEVVGSYHHSEYEEDLKKRMEAFINYLNL